MNAGPAFKFTNIFTSMITNYVLSNTEGWINIMNDYVYIFNFRGFMIT